MHIPDNFLNAPTLLATGIASAGCLSYALNKCRETLEEKNIPLLGITGAFVFAAQMLNFPVLMGTSGHFLGGMLAALILGPWAGALALTTVLILQCLIYQDGGLLALTANIFNMAVLGTIVTYFFYSWLLPIFPSRKPAIFLAAWLSVVLGACAAALELAFSGTAPLNLVLPAMAGIHAVIGIGEGIITLAVWEVLQKWRPDILGEKKMV